MDIPDPPPGYLPFPYQKEADEALAYLRREVDSTEGWKEIGTKGDIRMEKKNMPGDSSSIPLVRGKGLLKDVTPMELFAIISSPGCRSIWDERWLEGHPLERYTRKLFKFYSLQKGYSFFIQRRDFVGIISNNIHEDGSIEIVTCSVPENEKTGPVKGITRAELTIAAWSLIPKGNDVEGTYVVKTDPKGSLPTYLVNQVIEQIPGCLYEVDQYVHAHGHPPYMVEHPSYPIHSIQRVEKFDHITSQYNISFTGKAGDEWEFVVDKKRMYKDGFKWELGGEGKGGVSAEEKEDGVLKVCVGEEADEKVFEIVIEKK